MNSFEEKSKKIKEFMLELHDNSKIELPSDKQIIILSKMFEERDWDLSKPIELEMLHVMRGFIWGAQVMRQIVSGNNLE